MPWWYCLTQCDPPLWTILATPLVLLLISLSEVEQLLINAHFSYARAHMECSARWVTHKSHLSNLVPRATRPSHTRREKRPGDEVDISLASFKAASTRAHFLWQFLCDNFYFDKNNYKDDFIRRNAHRPTETNTNSTPTTTATIPYIKGTYNIRVAHRHITTLRHLLTNVKDKDEPNNRQGAVYKIKCSDCQASYIGETGRNLKTRLTEHKRASRNGDVNNHIAEHHRLTNHTIDWDSAQWVTYNTNCFQRLTLKADLLT